MTHVLSVKPRWADNLLSAWSRFYHRFDYWPEENGLRDLAAFISLIIFQSSLVLACWGISGWIIFQRTGE